MGKNGEFILWGIGKTDWEIPHWFPPLPASIPLVNFQCCKRLLKGVKEDMQGFPNKKFKKKPC